MRKFVANIPAMIPTVILSSAVGATIAITCLSTSLAHPVETRAREMLENGECQVEVGYPEFTVNDRCVFNKVMVGANSGNLYCARITVTCN